MLAAHKLGDMTKAEDGGSELFRIKDADEYEPANSVRPPSRLIFPGPRMQIQTRIFAGVRRYVLKDMFVIDLEYSEEEDGQLQVFASHRILPVHGHGPGQPEALAAFCEAFDFQWRHLVEVPEDSLTDGGKRRRQAMRDAVERVEDSAG